MISGSMATPGVEPGPTGTYLCQGYQIPIVLGHVVEFVTLAHAFEGRSRTAFDQGLQRSGHPPRDTFLRLVNRKIPGLNSSVIFSTLDSAIHIFGRSCYIVSRDYDLLKKLVSFAFDYDLIAEEQQGQLREEIGIRQRDLEGVETRRAAARQLQQQEADSKRKREEEALFEEEAVRASLEAEKKFKPSPSEASGSAAPSSNQSLFVIAPTVPTGRTLRSTPPVHVPPARHTQEIKLSSEELALIRSVKLALDAKERINWPAHKGLPEHDRLGPDAILDLAETVVDGVLPGAVITPASELPAFTYISFSSGRARVKWESASTP